MLGRLSRNVAAGTKCGGRAESDRQDACRNRVGSMSFSGRVDLARIEILALLTAPARRVRGPLEFDLHGLWFGDGRFTAVMITAVGFVNNSRYYTVRPRGQRLAQTSIAAATGASICI
jgi:hypothetical protein